MGYAFNTNNLVLCFLYRISRVVVEAYKFKIALWAHIQNLAQRHLQNYIELEEDTCFEMACHISRTFLDVNKIIFYILFGTLGRFFKTSNSEAIVDKRNTSLNSRWVLRLFVYAYTTEKIIIVPVFVFMYVCIYMCFLCAFVNDYFYSLVNI